MLIAQTGGVYSAVRLITVFILFIFVLGITYFTSRYIAGFQKKRMGSENIEVIEAARVTPACVLEIIRAGDKYMLIAIAKDKVTMLSELNPDSLSLGSTSLPQDQFQDLLGKAAQRFIKKRDEINTKDEGGSEGEK